MPLPRNDRHGTGRRAMRMLGIALLLALLGGCGNEMNPSVVGTLERDRIELVADAAEPLAKIVVREGEAVEAGQLLLQLDGSRVQARLDQAVAGRDEAAARLDELTRGPRDEDIAEARAVLQGAEEVFKVRQKELARQEDLLKRDLGSREARDQAKAQRDTALADRDSAKARLEALLNGTRPEQIEQARQALARAEASAAELREDLARLSVKAPVNGRVDELPFRLGEQPRVGDVLAVMYDGSHTYARVYVPEALRAQVRPGTTAEVAVDGVPDPLRGRVRWVSSDPTFTPYYALTEHDRGRLSYLAKIDVENGAEIPVGIPLEARFDLSSTGAQ